MSDRPSDWGDLGTGPLTDSELRQVRILLQDHARARWARRQLRVVAPWVIGAAGVVWGFVEWFDKYFQFRGRP